MIRLPSIVKAATAALILAMALVLPHPPEAAAMPVPDGQCDTSTHLTLVTTCADEAAAVGISISRFAGLVGAGLLTGGVLVDWALNGGESDLEQCMEDFPDDVCRAVVGADTDQSSWSDWYQRWHGDAWGHETDDGTNWIFCGIVPGYPGCPSTEPEGFGGLAGQLGAIFYHPGTDGNANGWRPAGEVPNGTVRFDVGQPTSITVWTQGFGSPMNSSGPWGLLTGPMSGGALQWGMYVQTGSLKFYAGPGSSEITISSSQASPQLIGVVWDGIDTFHFYRDGTLVGTRSRPSGCACTEDPVGLYGYTAAQGFASTYQNVPWKGWARHMTIYDQALTVGDMVDLLTFEGEPDFQTGDWEINPPPEVPENPYPQAPAATPAPVEVPTTLAAPALDPVPEKDPYTPVTEGAGDQGLFDQLANRIGGIIDGLAGAIGGAFGWLGDLFTDIIHWLAQQLWGMFQWLFDNLAALIEWLGGILGQILDALGLLGEHIATLFLELFGVLGDLLGALGEAILWGLEGVVSAIDALFGAIASIPSLILDGLEWLFIPSAPVTGLQECDTAFPCSWVIEFVDALGVIGATAEGAGACTAPAIGWTEFTISFPPPAGCGTVSGAIVGEGTSSVGDLFGYRVALRAALLAAVSIGFVMWVLSMTPWAEREFYRANPTQQSLFD